MVARYNTNIDWDGSKIKRNRLPIRLNVTDVHSDARVSRCERCDDDYAVYWESSNKPHLCVTCEDELEITNGHT